MDTNSLLCIIEVLGAILFAIAAAVIRNWASIQQSFTAIGETTRNTRPQWFSVLAGVLGSNLGYIILTGTYSLTSWPQDPNTVEAFLFPTIAVVYLFCAIPAYLPIGTICGLLIYRFTQGKGIGSRAGYIIALAVSTILGAIIAIPINLVGLIAAAL